MASGAPGRAFPAAAAQGETEARKVIEQSAFYLGRGIALLMDILNLQCIVIGSIFARNELLFRPLMETVIAAEALEGTRQQCCILSAQLGELLGDYAALGVAVNGIQLQDNLKVEHY